MIKLNQTGATNPRWAEARATLLAKYKALQPAAARPFHDHEHSAEALESATILAAVERDLADAARAYALLSEVKFALKRIDDGDYSVCVDCDTEIPAVRLAAVPWANRCAPCQSAHEGRTVTRLTHRQMWI